MTTRGYGMAVAVLLLSVNAGDAWLPRFSSSSRTQSVSLSSNNDNEEEIAAAWRNLNADMTQNDQAALEVLKEVRTNFQQLAKSAGSSKKEDTPLKQAHDLPYDPATADLVAQLASQEAMEVAEKEARINKAKQESEGVLMQAKWDLQMASIDGVEMAAAALEEVQETTPILTEEEQHAQRLAAELKALDAMEVSFQEALREFHSPTPTPFIMSTDEMSTMDAFTTEDTTTSTSTSAYLPIIDAAIEPAVSVQEEVVDVAQKKAPSPPSPPAYVEQYGFSSDSPVTTGTTPEEATTPMEQIDVPVPQAEATEPALQENVVQKKAPPPPQFVPQQEYSSNSPVTMGTATIVQPPPQQQDVVSSTTKNTSPEQQQQQHQQLEQARELREQLALVEPLNKRQAAKLRRQLSALLLDPLEAEAEQHLAVKLEEDDARTEAISEEVAPTTVSSIDAKATKLKRQLAALEANHFAIEVDMARSDAVKNDAAKEVKPRPVVVSKKKKRSFSPHSLLLQEVATFAREIDIERSNAVHEDANMAVMVDARIPLVAKRRTVSLEALLEVTQFALGMDAARSEAVKKQASIIVPRKKKTPAIDRVVSAKALLEASQFAMEVDATRSEAVKKEASVIALRKKKKTPTIDRVVSIEALLEATRFAAEIDTARSDAVKKEASIIVPRKKRTPAIDRVVSAEALLEMTEFALALDAARSDAVKKEANLIVPRKKKMPAIDRVVSAEALLEASQFAMEMDAARSNAVKEEASISVPRKKMMPAIDRVVSPEALLEVNQFSMEMDAARSDAVKKAASIIFPRKKKTPAVNRVVSAEALLEVTQFAMEMDAARSEAVKKETNVKAQMKLNKTSSIPLVQQQAKQLREQLALLEAKKLAIQMDMARSNAVKEETEFKVQMKEPQASNRVVSLQALLEAAEFAIQIDMSRSNSIMADVAILEEAKVKTSKKVVASDRVVSTEALLETADFAIQMDMARSNAIMADLLKEEAKAKISKKSLNRLLTSFILQEASQFAIEMDTARSNAVNDDLQTHEEESRLLKKKIVLEAKRLEREANALEAAQFALQVDLAKSVAVEEDVKLEALRKPAAKVIEPVVSAAEKVAEVRAEEEAAEVLAEEEAAEVLAEEEAAEVLAEEEAAEVLAEAEAAKVLAEEEAAEVLAQEETIVESEAELFTLGAQNPNQVLQVIDVEALQSAAQDVEALKNAAQEVQDASELLSSQPENSNEHESVIQEALETAETVLQDVQKQQSIFLETPIGTATKGPNNVVKDPTGPSLADLNNHGMTPKQVQQVQEMMQRRKNRVNDPTGPSPADHGMPAKKVQERMRPTRNIVNDPAGPSLADMNNHGMTGKKVEEVQEMKNAHRIPRPQMLEPMPQDVTDHQEDAERFFFAKRAADEISMNQDPYVLEKNKAAGKMKPAEEVSAAEVAEQEQEEVDRKLKDLFADLNIGFAEVKQSLARMLVNDDSADDDGSLGGASNTTEGVGP